MTFRRRMNSSTWQVIPKQASKAKEDDAKLAPCRSHASSGRAAFTTREAGFMEGSALQSIVHIADHRGSFSLTLGQ
jgi:hypothetical protein